MLAEQQSKNANYRRIVARLRHLLTSGMITQKEYNRAKVYYKNLIGADLIIAD